MADDNAGTPPIKVIQNTVPTPAAQSLAVRSVNVVIDSHNKSPGGMPTEIVELELWVAGQGNAPWMQWADLARFRCERGQSQALIALLGLTPSK